MNYEIIKIVDPLYKYAIRVTSGWPKEFEPYLLRESEKRVILFKSKKEAQKFLEKII